VLRTRHQYGQHHAQVADQWRPQVRGDLPVVMLIHGGFWRARYSKLLMRQLAAAVVRKGWIAWNIEYRRLGPLGGRGGWPETFEDVGAAFDHLRTLERCDLGRIVICGHSAGATLALWAARGRHSRTGSALPSIRPRGVVALAPLCDLGRAAEHSIGGHAVTRLLGGSPQDYPERYRDASPISQVPLAVPQLLIHCIDDPIVPRSMSEHYAERARSVGDDVTLPSIEGSLHGRLLHPRSPEWRTAEHQIASWFDSTGTEKPPRA
jgi:acetyl esterase/lipase